jgi:1-deoxy-D-xylulose-5-phosphate synthase
MTVMTPSDENECRQMLYTAFELPAPTAVRYPRGSGPGVAVEQEMTALALGRGELRREGKRIAILAFGAPLTAALQAAEDLDATVANMRFVKPLDEALLAKLARTHEYLVTVEENVVMGGAGTAVLEALERMGLPSRVLQLGLPDRFVEHGDPASLIAECGLDAAGISRSIGNYIS